MDEKKPIAEDEAQAIRILAGAGYIPAHIAQETQRAAADKLLQKLGDLSNGVGRMLGVWPWAQRGRAGLLFAGLQVADREEHVTISFEGGGFRVQKWPKRDRQHGTNLADEPVKGIEFAPALQDFIGTDEDTEITPIPGQRKPRRSALVVLVEAGVALLARPERP